MEKYKAVSPGITPRSELKVTGHGQGSSDWRRVSPGITPRSELKVVIDVIGELHDLCLTWDHTQV